MGLLQHIEHQISAINDLVKINNDRIAGYEKATESVEDANLTELFAQYIDQSKQNNIELADVQHVLGGELATGTTLSGKFYHTWIDVKAKFSKKDRRSILSDCEYGEDVASAAYLAALDDKELIWQSEDIAHLLSRQLKDLKDAHNNIKDLRDTADEFAKAPKSAGEPTETTL